MFASVRSHHQPLLICEQHTYAHGTAAVATRIDLSINTTARVPRCQVRYVCAGYPLKRSSVRSWGEMVRDTPLRKNSHGQKAAAAASDFDAFVRYVDKGTHSSIRCRCTWYKSAPWSCILRAVSYIGDGDG